jgi:hypothetical protein
MMIRAHDTKLVLIWLMLTGSLVASLLLIQAGSVSNIASIVLFISGVIAFFVLWVTSLIVSASARGMDNSPVKTGIAFDEFTVRQTVREGRESLPVGVHASTNIVDVDFRELASPRSLTAEGLLELDKALALAKVRMDLEAELRQIARAQDVVSRARSAGALANELGQKGILPRPLISALLEVISVANQAIHGANISDETAASVVRTASDLLDSLRLASASTESMLRFATLEEFEEWLATDEASSNFAHPDVVLLQSLAGEFQRRHSRLNPIRDIQLLTAPDGRLDLVTYDQR